MALAFDQLVAGAMTVGMRVSALVLFAPGLNGIAIPAKVKAGLVVAITVLLASSARVPVLENPSDWLWVCVGEVAVGLAIATALNVVIDGAQLAGHLLGTQMGFSLVNVMDPQTQVDTPVLSMLHTTLALLLFFHFDVHHWVLRGIANSFEYMPPGRISITGEVVSEMLRVVGGVWLIGIQIAAPALLATMFADLVMAFLGKASPSLPVLFIGISIKTLVGLVVTIAAIAFWPAKFESYFASALATGERLLGLAH